MLEKLFTSKTRIKIMEFLFFEKEESYIRELSTKLKISPSAVKREVENLEKIEIIKKQSNKIFLNKRSNITEDLKNIFIKTDFIIHPIKGVLKNNKIKFALIFGSFAKGNCSPESDVDLLIVGEVKLSEVFKLIKPLEDKIQKEINPVVWKIDDLIEKKESGFVRDIFKKRIIMIIGDENEIRKIVR